MDQCLCNAIYSGYIWLAYFSGRNLFFVTKNTFTNLSAILIDFRTETVVTDALGFFLHFFLCQSDKASLATRPISSKKGRREREGGGEGNEQVAMRKAF